MNNTNTNTGKNKSDEWKKREIGSLWKKKNASGSTYCTGIIVVDELGAKIKKRVIMFSNKEKRNENAPDFIIYLSNEDGQNSAPTNSNSSSKTQAAKPPVKPQTVANPEPAPVENDEIPDEL